MGRRRQSIVCQHLENLSSDLLEKYAEYISKLVSRRYGVYALYRKKQLYYVGLATNLRNRLRQHLVDRHRGLWDRFSVYLTIEDAHLRELESLVVRIAQPQGNKQRGKFAKSVDLKRQLEREIRAQSRVELQSLLGKASKLVTRLKKKVRDPKECGPAELVGRFPKRVLLRATFKGETYRAILRTDGLIRYATKLFRSPSHAAVAVVKRPINGWWFWKYERAPRQWVRLSELRR